MTIPQKLLVLLGTCIVAACGGGGGGSPPITANVAINTTNARAVAVTALEAVTNPYHLLGATGTLSILANNPTASVFTQTQACGNGGSANIGGRLVNLFQPGAGDLLSATYNNCGILTALGAGLVLNGQIATTFTTATASRLSFRSTLTNLTITVPGKLFQFSGDQLSDWDVTNANLLTYSTSGNALAVRADTPIVARNSVWNSYLQTVVVSNGNVSYALNTLLQSDNGNVGPGGGTFNLTTTTAIVRNSATTSLIAGAIRITGVSNTSMLATVVGPDTIRIDVDANGDGVFEATLATTSAELETFR
jgi:hypothetical protein